MKNNEVIIFKNGKYNAQFISKYLIKTAHKMGVKVSNLKLQKLLYFTQKAFYLKTGEFLFNDDFVAWNYGPVIPKIYYEYRYNSSEPIIAKFPGFEPKNIEDSVKEVVELILKTFGQLNIWDLVNLSHEEEAWKKHHNKKNTTISKTEIVNFLEKENE